MTRRIDEHDDDAPRYDPFDDLFRDEEPDYATTEDAARKHLQDFVANRRDKYVSASRICEMGHRLAGEAVFKNRDDWIPYLIMIRKWCETSEQEG